MSGNLKTGYFLRNVNCANLLKKNLERLKRRIILYSKRTMLNLLGGRVFPWVETMS